MIGNGLLGNKKTWQRWDSFFILDSIKTIFSNDNDALRKKINLDVCPKVSPEKQFTFSVETPDIYQQLTQHL